MKNKIKFLEIIALIAVIGFTMTVCSAPDRPEKEPPQLTGTVSISGTAEVGQTLSVNTNNLNGSGTIFYQWKRGGTTIYGETDSTYVVQTVDVGSTITVTVTRSGYSGSVTSVQTVTVADPRLPQLTGTVSITGTAQVGQTLTANTANLGGSGTISYQWNREETAISDATGSTYTLQTADAGSNITVTVTRSGYSGSITSTSVSVIFVLVFSNTISGSITEINTKNRYVVILALPGTLSVSVTSPGGTSALPNNGIDIKWLNSSGTQIKGTSSGFNFPYNDSMDLEIGTYYIEIIGRSGIGNTGLYNIRADYFTDEEEPNDSLETAQLLVPGLTVNGYITTSDTTDMFKYVLTQPGRFTVNMTNGTISIIDIRWYTANGTQILSGRSYSSYSNYMDFEAGTYYIGIEKYSNYTGTYNLRADFNVAGNNETEPNSTREVAQLLALGQTVKGFISYQDTIDMYKYVLTQPGRFTVNMTNDTISIIDIKWYTANGTQILSGRSYSSYSNYMDLEAGTYYIGIEKYSDYTGTYNLSANLTTAENNEVEPNNERVTAQLLTSGQTVKGFINYQDNIDMYRIVLTKQSRMTVNMTNGTISIIDIRWYTANGTQILNGRSYSSYSNYMDLEAGTYYIGIEEYSDYTGTYNLTVTW